MLLNFTSFTSCHPFVSCFSEKKMSKDWSTLCTVRFHCWNRCLLQSRASISVCRQRWQGAPCLECRWLQSALFHERESLLAFLHRKWRLNSFYLLSTWSILVRTWLSFISSRSAVSGGGFSNTGVTTGSWGAHATLSLSFASFIHKSGTHLWKIHKYQHCLVHQRIKCKQQFGNLLALLHPNLLTSCKTL